jgi:AcrR family transcriptional regulator
MTADEATGRLPIIDAAIASILEVGFYRSSTNEIARRANVSWGAVQYHFGTREALLLAVLEELDRRFVSHLQTARIVGDTAEERIASLYELLADTYEDPTFLVRMQLLLNLQHDPDTSGDVAAELAAHSATSETAVRRLLRDAIRTDDSTATNAIFHAVRGFALSLQLSRATPTPGDLRGDEPEVRSAFLRRLAAAYASP